MSRSRRRPPAAAPEARVAPPLAGAARALAPPPLPAIRPPIGAPPARDADDPRQREFVQGLQRGFAVVKAFSADGGRRLTVADVAGRTGLTRAVARRYLLTLQELGYVVHDGSHFTLTPRILDLGFTYLATVDVANIAQPFMERIVHTLRESCSIAVLDGHDAVYVARVAAKRIMSINLVVGSRLPAHATSMGKVLLANLSDADLDEYFRTAPLQRLTSRTIGDEPTLRAALRQVRERGWAFADQESEDGVRTVAVPLFDRNMRVQAAMNVSGHASRVPMKELRSRYLPVLMETANEISRALGADIPPRKRGA
jgi:IclR family transcriptional regulator, pca regulon regulatory protein